MRKRVLLTLFFGMSAALAVSAIGQTVYTSDFIADATRTGFNGFEGIPNDGTFYTGGGGPYNEGGIQVEQLLGDAGNDIWVTYFLPEGSFGWYPSGGDSGWTRIAMTDTSDFFDVGFLRGSGFGDAGTSIYYELRLDGATVLSGSVANGNNGGAGFYLGFGGGGFDEIWLAEGFGISGFPHGSLNALAIDAIEIRASAIPEPTSVGLLGMGLIACCGVWRRRKA